MRQPAGSPLSWRFLLAFSSLALLLHELHELAHTVTGRLLCGGWGTRDFNVWRLAEGCTTYVPTAIGPLLSYAIMYLGVALTRSPRFRLLGVALALAPNPFARLFTALMGGGDEMVLARVLAGTGKTPVLRLAVIVVVGALALPPILAAWRGLEPYRRSIAFPLLLLAPMILTGVLYFVLGNRLLAAGVLATPLIGGDPLLIFLTTVATAIATGVTVRWLMPSGAATGERAPA
jgi:hypothetical protein